ncbi:MAG: S4 domain-containing protein, partial [Pseudomonadota bacterium]
MGSTRLTVKPEGSRNRLDHFLSDRFRGLTRSRIKKLIEDGHVLVNGSMTKAGTLVKAGDIIDMHIPESRPPGITAQDLPLTVLYEDSDLIVIDKAPHMVVHPSHGHSSGTLVN